MGRCLQDKSRESQWAHHTYFFTDIDTLDICDMDQVDSFVSKYAIDVIVNAAAYTAVDQAEEDVEAAYRLNCDAVDNLAAVSKHHGAYLVHISTDYVFKGDVCRPHEETEALDPQSVYGKSKAAGEDAIRKSGCKATIIRTSWLYSEYGHNFVKTMLKLGAERQHVTVVCDQLGGPTCAGDLAQVILQAVEVNHNKHEVQTYHFANEGCISWYDFAQAIMEIAKKNCKVYPIFTHEYPAKAPRPSYSAFNLSKIKRELGIDIPYWRESLALTINKLQG